MNEAMITKQIWKFQLPVSDIANIEMPKGAQILKVDTQYDIPYIWALVDPSHEIETKVFEIFGTGHLITYPVGSVRNYIGTFMVEHGTYVFHVFERIK